MSGQRCYLTVTMTRKGFDQRQRTDAWTFLFPENSFVCLLVIMPFTWGLALM